MAAVVIYNLHMSDLYPEEIYGPGTRDNMERMNVYFAGQAQKTQNEATQPHNTSDKVPAKPEPSPLINIADTISASGYPF